MNLRKNENKVVETLLSKGLIIKQSHFDFYGRSMLRYTFVILLIFSAYWFGLSQNDQKIETSNSSYIVLLYGQSKSDNGEKNIRSEYERWMSESNQIIEGKELQKNGQMIRLINQEIDLSSSSRVSGYFIINADNYDDAFSIAKQCPHLLYGGDIELRPLIN